MKRMHAELNILRIIFLFYTLSLDVLNIYYHAYRGLLGKSFNMLVRLSKNPDNARMEQITLTGKSSLS